MADAKVVVHTDTSKEQNAGVQVGIEQEAYHFAKSHAEGPVAAVAIVVDEHGQGENIQYIRHGQVEHEHSSSLPGPHFECKHPQSHGVQVQPQDAHQTVRHRQQDGLEFLVKAAACI